MRRVRIILLCFLAVMLASGCATTIIPPKQVQTPAKVYLLDFGRTASLVLPNTDGGMTRYAYGDWDWYARRQTGMWNAITALAWPTEGALGRERLPASPDQETLKKHLPYPAENIYELTVDQDKALALSRQLDAAFAARPETLFHQPEVSLEFVRYPERYWAFHNSNHVTVRWLEQLGADTRGCPVWSSWQVRTPSR